MLIYKTMNWANGLQRFHQSQYKTVRDSQPYPQRYNKCDPYWNEKPFDVGQLCVKVATHIQLWLQVRGFLIFLIGREYMPFPVPSIRACDQMDMSVLWWVYQ